ncbi:MAG: serine protease [Candidatus Tectomicrobia bacterium]|nr:serine protease [Candidatus Tectomicrobia bacterium]
MGDYLKFLERVVPCTVNIHSFIPEGHPSSRTLGTERMGSGVIIGREGFILTVGYTVFGARKLIVSLTDNRQVPAKIVCYDFESGLAVLKMQSGGPYRYAELGTSGLVKESSKTIIISSTGKFDRTATKGFITSIRPFDAYWEYMLDHAILTTAETPGFGGGPLLDNLGRVIGIVSLSLGSMIEKTLAIPIDLFNTVKEEIFRTGTIPNRIPRPWIGFYTESCEGGVMVIGITPDGPASKSNLQVKDIILDINGVEVSSRRELYEELWKHKAGEEIVFTVLRNGELESITVESVDRALFYR